MVGTLKFKDIDLKLNEFVPFWPFWTGHTQTILSHVAKTKINERPWTEKLIDVSDGDQILIKYLNQNGKTTLSVYHGLTGNSESDYMRRTAEIGLALGWNVILVNHRGVNSKAIAHKTYHSGRGDDASAVIEWSKTNFLNTKQVATGFSMSGSILLNLATGLKGEVRPDYAVTVNAPLNLSHAAFKLKTGFSKLYDLRFYMRLKKLAAKKGFNNFPMFGTVNDVDNLYTSVMNGYKNAEDYYQKCSVGPVLKNLKVKTFVLSSYDDPFIGIEDYLNANWNEHAHVTLIKQGGHMGFYSKNKDPKYSRMWMDHYLESVFKQINLMD